ncbi:hypothetical protein M5D96_010260 [Drosophila gunungcola]|uniref:Uncharacterized protein n=1 Tax=Drosophila gunungcola TaxID=103775 RepID=A0A9P9YI02_9MUSC|nr:hypothetical protein M5D96_010260 [Drosophila gunungcola]
MNDSRRNTATEFSYILQRQGSDVSVAEAYAFDDFNNIMKRTPGRPIANLCCTLHLAS